MKTIRCSVCHLLIACDGDPGPVGRITIPGNHEPVERDGFATTTETPECEGSEMLTVVEVLER